MTNYSRFELKSLTDKITKGTTPTTLGYSYKPSGISFIRVQNLVNGAVDTTIDSLYIDEETHSTLKRSIIKPNDVLIGIAGTIGRCVVVSEYMKEMNCNQAVAIVRTKNLLYNRYLYHWLNTRDAMNQISGSKVTATISNLSLTQIGKLKVPLPPLPIQKKIVSVLDKAQELIDLRKKQIQLLDDLIQSIFYDMFGDPVTNPKGWDVNTLNFISDVLMGQSPNGESYNSNAQGTPLLNGPTEFGKKHPLEKQWTTSPKKLSIKGDILFCVRGATAGRLNVADKEYCIGRGLAAIRVKRKEYFDFLILFLRLKYSYFQSIGSGSTFINISRNQLESMQIILPPLELQSRFTSIIEKIELQKDRLEISLIGLENNFKSLQQRAFRGELFNMIY